jgi:subtilisin family serine protease
MSERGGVFRLPPYQVEQQLTALSETVDWGLEFAGIPQQWKATRGEGVSVAVLDTGAELGHPDLREAVEDARDFTRSRFGPEDRQGHGTHVCGTVGARQNDVGVIGVAPGVRLLVGKVLGDDGSGSERDVAAGIDWAVERGARIISMSLGSAQPSVAIKRSMERALGAGRFVICAAGNDGGRESVNYPAKWPGPVIVGAVDREGRLAVFSSRGEEMRERGICAPGQDVLSTYLGGSYARLSGTSMATPFVTGVVALALAKHAHEGGRTPIGTQQDLIAHLRKTAREAGESGPDREYGLGLVNPEGLLKGEQEHEGTELAIGGVTVNGVAGSLVFVPTVG